MVDSDGESSASSGFLAGFAKDLAAGGDRAPVEDSGSSSDDCTDPFSRPFTPGVPENARPGVAVYAGKLAKLPVVADAAEAAKGVDGGVLHSGDGVGELSEAKGAEVDLDKVFAELEAAEALQKGNSESDDALVSSKRRRLEKEVAGSTCASATQSPQHESATLACASSAVPLAPPPEEVVEAFATLDLPITTTSSKEVEKKSRRLAFRWHPDKVNPKRRWQAAQQFRRIQTAKEIVLGWLAHGRRAEDSDHSEVPGCVSGDEESSGMGDAGGNESGSVSDEALEELQACGIKPRSMSRSPSAERSDDQSDGDDFGAELAVRRQPISAGQDTLAQALALKSQAGKSHNQRMCSE